MLADNIRFLRKQAHLTQEDFAERLGVSRQSVAKWENGESTPDINKCREIADCYDVSVDALISVPLSERGQNEETSNGKYIFGIVKVGDRGQVVIPKYAREVFSIKPGDRMLVMGDTAKGGIALAKIALGSMIGEKE